MDAGIRVTAVEPNLQMRLESDRQHAANPLYSSVNGTAESTHLDANSVDMITAAQAAHWFDLKKSTREFARILRSGGVLVLIWNRRMRNSPFQTAYERLLNTLPEYAQVNHANLDDAQLASLFNGDMQRINFANSQAFDQASFRGRVFSSSYTPNPDDLVYEEFSRKIDELFSVHSTSAKVTFSYTTQIYAGRLA